MLFFALRKVCKIYCFLVSIRGHNPSSQTNSPPPLLCGSSPVSSSHTCDRLKQEKDEALSTMEEVLLKVQEQHGSQLAQLEDRLQTFYQAEWDKVHLTYQQEADKYKALMEQQVRKTGTHRHTHTH